jgi:hypothetical protein
MSQLKVKTVVDTTLARGNVTQADLSAVGQAVGVHRSKKERAQMERLIDAIDNGSVKVLAPDNPIAIKSGLELTASSGFTPAASFKYEFFNTVTAPGIKVGFHLVGPRKFWGTVPALVVAATTTLLLSPVTVPLGSILGVAAALKD